MASEQKYFHDRLVLVLLTVSAFVAVLTSLLILLKLDSNHSDVFIVQVRQNLGVGGFKAGHVTEVLAFIPFAFIVLIINAILGFRIYRVRREYAVTILGMALLLEVLTLIVSNSLLVLR